MTMMFILQGFEVVLFRNLLGSFSVPTKGCSDNNAICHYIKPYTQSAKLLVIRAVFGTAGH